jgi:hypothetical protein
MLQLAKHVHAKFYFSSFYPDGLRQIFDNFTSKFHNLFKKISKISDSGKIIIEHPQIKILNEFYPFS